jgi:queuine/archaeosine tRNA-ribosyltransferase
MTLPHGDVNTPVYMPVGTKGNYNVYKYKYECL